METVFPSQAYLLAQILTAHGLEWSVDQAFLLGRPLNFFYLRGPHLTPPHQISGLSPTFLKNGLHALGFEAVPLKPDEIETLAAELPPGASAGEISGERIGRANDVRYWIVAAEPIPVGRTSGGDTSGVKQEWEVLEPSGAPVSPDEALAGALVANAYAMMICSGAWQGVDGIEYFSEDVSRWDLLPEWSVSAATAAETIAESDGLWRRAFAVALEHFRPASQWANLWRELADEWRLLGEDLAESARTGQSRRLEQVGRKLLRIAHQESRAWGRLIDAFGAGI